MTDDPRNSFPEAGESTTADIQKLQREIQHLQHDKKQLQVRAQGLQALGKVLEQSQEENIQLRHEIECMKELLQQSGISNTHLPLSRSDSKYSFSEYGSRYPDSRSTLSGHYPMSVNPETGNLSDCSSEPSSIFNGDLLHVKDVLTKLELLKKEYEALTEQVQQLKDSATGPQEFRTDVQLKLASLCTRLESNRKEARTRETLARALVVEEEEMKQKLQAMEAEQTSYEAAITQLEKAIAEGKAEFENLKGNMHSALKKAPTGENAQSSSSSPSSISSGGPTEETAVVKSSAAADASGDCGHCAQLQRQNSELQRQLDGLRNERDEAVRQKEEILDVNHAWDAQYRKLQAEMLKEINDLKQQNEILKDGDQSRKFDKLWSAARKTVDTERKAMEQEKKELTEQIRALEEEKNALAVKVDQGQNQIRTLQQKLHLMSFSKGQRQEASATSGKPSLLPSPPNASVVSPTGVQAAMPFGREPSPEIIDQIEALKQQLRVYADDFQSERSDRERMQSEKDSLKEQLEAVQQQVLVLEAQVRIYEDDFRSVKREKEELESQLRAGAGHLGGPYQPRVPDVSRRAQSVAEQQAKVDAIREIHEREQRRLLRERQELQQHYTQRQVGGRYSSNFVPPYMPAARYPYTSQESETAYLHARGPADEMFRGGEVFPDRGVEVEDGNTEKKTKEDKGSTAPHKQECPRCLREFSEEEAMLNHIEKCLP